MGLGVLALVNLLQPGYTLWLCDIINIFETGFEWFGNNRDVEYKQQRGYNVKKFIVPAVVAAAATIAAIAVAMFPKTRTNV